MFKIRNEKETDYRRVEEITRKAFGIYMLLDVMSIILFISCELIKILYRNWIL